MKGAGMCRWSCTGLLVSATTRLQYFEFAGNLALIVERDGVWQKAVPRAPFGGSVGTSPRS